VLAPRRQPPDVIRNWSLGCHPVLWNRTLINWTAPLGAPEAWHMSAPNAPRPPAGPGPFSGQSFPDVYEQELVGPLFDPWVGSLLEDVR
jgi:hypothetical protein